MSSQEACRRCLYEGQCDEGRAIGMVVCRGEGAKGELKEERRDENGVIGTAACRGRALGRSRL